MKNKKNKNLLDLSNQNDVEEPQDYVSRQQLERDRNISIKKSYAKLFSFMRQHEDEIGKDYITEFIDSHSDFDKETITFVVYKYESK